MEGGERIPALRSAKCCAVFKTARKTARPAAEDDARFAFVCGFLSHMALDIVFHPWVYAVTGPYYDPDPDKQADSQMSHRLVESWLDLLMLQRFEKTRNNFDPLKAIRANSMTNLDCLDFFAESFRTAWRIEGDVGRYLRRFYTVQMLLGRLFPSQTATTAIALLNRLTKGRLRAFTALFYPTRPERMPAGLFEFQNFRHPVTGQTIDSNLDQLWERSPRTRHPPADHGREYPRRGGSRSPSMPCWKAAAST